VVILDKGFAQQEKKKKRGRDNVYRKVISLCEKISLGKSPTISPKNLERRTLKNTSQGNVKVG